MKKVCAIMMIAILILCLCGCYKYALDTNGNWELETISNEEGKLIYIGGAFMGETVLPKKNVTCEIKSDSAIVFIENKTTLFNGTYTIEDVKDAELLHVSMDNGKTFDITCGEKKNDNENVGMTMIFNYENKIVVFSKQ